MPLETLFVPLIRPDRLAQYAPTDFALAFAADGALEITFTPKAAEDLDVYMPSRGLFFSLPAGSPIALPGGPTTTPLAAAVAIQLLNTSEILKNMPTGADAPPTFATWWIVEGIDPASLIQGVQDNFDEAALASRAGYGTDVAGFLAAVGAGQTSITYMYRDAAGADVASPFRIATLAGTVGSPLTVRLSAHYAWDQPPVQYRPQPASNGLSTIGALKPTPLANHPLVAQAKAAVLAGDLSFHVSFQRFVPSEVKAVSETDKGSFVPLPAGTVVRLMKVNTSNTDQRQQAASGTLNASGMVEFAPGGAAPSALPRSALALAPGWVHAFLVEFSDALVTQYQRDGTPRAAPSTLGVRTAGNWPTAWMTYGLADVSGGPGSWSGLASLASTSLALPSAPLVFNVGIPVFLQILYARLRCVGRVYSTSDDRAPKGVKVAIRNKSNTVDAEFRTDEHGQVWGVLTRWDPKDVEIRIVVQYEMEDRPAAGSFYPIKLPRITGVVEDQAGAQVSAFDSSWTDPRAGRTTFGFAGAFTGATLGTPAGAATATGLEQMRVGAIDIKPSASGSTYDLSHDIGGGALKPLLGEHGGLIHAFKVIRHGHEWWSQLTATAAEPWADLFDGLHRAAPAPPILRVVAKLEANPAIRGGATFVTEGGVDLFSLTLLCPPTWSSELPVLGSRLAHDTLLSLLWSHETVHHEFTHIVFLAASELFGANKTAFAQAVAAYNPGYDVLAIEPLPVAPTAPGGVPAPPVTSFAPLDRGPLQRPDPRDRRGLLRVQFPPRRRRRGARDLGQGPCTAGDGDQPGEPGRRLGHTAGTDGSRRPRERPAAGVGA